MKASSYKVENIFKAYNKQTGTKKSTSNKTDNPIENTDIITLSSENNKEEAYEKISYGLLNVMLQTKEPE